MTKETVDCDPGLALRSDLRSVVDVESNEIGAELQKFKRNQSNRSSHDSVEVAQYALSPSWICERMTDMATVSITVQRDRP